MHCSAECECLNCLCSTLVQQDGKCMAQKKTNASLWESQSNGCVEYQCDNKAGFISRSKCNSSNDETCVNDKCVAENSMDDKEWAVVIELNMTGDEKIAPEEISAELSELSGVNSSEFSIGIEYDSKGKPVRVIVYVTDKETAAKIEASLNEIDKGPSCEGILCRSDKVDVRQVKHLFLEGSPALMNHLMSIVSLLVTIFIDSTSTLL